MYCDPSVAQLAAFAPPAEVVPPRPPIEVFVDAVPLWFAPPPPPANAPLSYPGEAPPPPPEIASGVLPVNTPEYPPPDEPSSPGGLPPTPAPP